MFHRPAFVVIAAAGVMSTLAACTCNGCEKPEDSTDTAEDSGPDDTATAATDPEE